MKYSYTEPYGSGEITVHADDIEELHFEIKYVRELHRAAEIGKTTDVAFPDAYVTKSKNKYIGFRRPDGAFVAFGKSQENDVRPFFAHKPGYQNEDRPNVRYKGYQIMQDGEIYTAPPLTDENSGSPESLEEKMEGISREQAQELWKLAQKNGWTEEGMKRYLAGFGLSSMLDIPKDLIEEAFKEVSFALKAPFYNLDIPEKDKSQKPPDSERKKFHAQGMKLAELMEKDWDDLRPWIVRFMTNGESESSNDLCALQVFALNQALKTEIDKRKA